MDSSVFEGLLCDNYCHSIVQGFPRFLILGALLFAVSTSVHAMPIGYNFEYEFGTGEVLSGMLEGELQADLDTVVVTSLFMAAFTGLPGVDFQTDLLFNTTTISGAGGSFVTIAPGGLLAGFQLPFGTTAVIGTLGDFGFRTEAFSADRWSLTPKGVPAPATLALFGMGLAGLGWSRRKKA